MLEKMNALTSTLLFIAAFSVAQADPTHDSLDSYPFRMVLNDNPSYVLHWSVNVTEKMVRFAVNTSARGWVGLGLSRTGQMIGSDVVTAWVDESGRAQLQVSQGQ